jgi:hypothetical protein
LKGFAAASGFDTVQIRREPLFLELWLSKSPPEPA